MLHFVDSVVVINRLRIEVVIVGIVKDLVADGASFGVIVAEICC